MLKSVFGNEDDNIGKLSGALQLLERNGYKTHFEVFTAQEMIGVFVKNREKCSPNKMEKHAKFAAPSV